MRCNSQSVNRIFQLSTLCIASISCTTVPEPSPPIRSILVQEEVPVAQAYALDQTEIGAVEVLGSDSQGRVMLGETLVGEAVVLSDYLTKVVLVNYWSSWCTACGQIMSELQVLHDEYGPLGLVVVTVNYGETSQAVKDYLVGNSQAPMLIHLMDRSGQASEGQGIFSVPAVILYDRTGQEIGRYVHDFDVGRLRKDLSAFLK